jgi:ABC-2 type transport system ATP-binding protein
VASALLADPDTLILDEPVNGLDPDGIRWIRNLLRRLAGEGRTIFLSSHLMSEMAVTADHVIVVGKGRLLRDQPMAAFIADASTQAVRVRSPQAGRLTSLLAAEGAAVHSSEVDLLSVDGMSNEQIGMLAAAAGITLYELTPQAASLEEAYMALTADTVAYRSADSQAAAA